MLRARWLGRVPYGEADRFQRALHERAADDYLLLLEHPHVYTLGTTADPAHVLVPPATVGAELVHADRGGDVTYHGPGPARRVPDRHAARVARRPARRRRVRAHARGRRSSARSPASASRRTAEPQLHRRVGGRREDRRHRREGRAWPHPPRLRAQRRSRPRDVRPHRAVRHPRPRRHVDGRACSATAPEMRAVVDAVVAQFAGALRCGDGRAPGRRVARAPRRPQRVHPRRRWPAMAPAPAPRQRWCEARRCGCSVAWPRPACRSRSTAPGDAPARVDAGEGRPRRRLPRDQAARAAARPPHRVRGGGLPQHLRVLGRPHRHVHDPGRPLHPGVRLLPGRHPQAAPARPRRAPPRGRRGASRSGSSTR